MKTNPRFLLAASLVFAMAFTFSCSSDNDDDPDNFRISSSSATNIGISSSSLVTDIVSSSSATNIVISSSSSVVVGTQYYDVMIGNWSTACPNLNDYPALINNVIALTDDFVDTILGCLINSEVYSQNTSSQVSSYLTTNGLSGYANDFNLRIAASPHNTAFLIYLNTSNYYRVLIIGYQ